MNNKEIIIASIKNSTPSVLYSHLMVLDLTWDDIYQRIIKRNIDSIDLSYLIYNGCKCSHSKNYITWKLYFSQSIRKPYHGIRFSYTIPIRR